MKYTIDNPKTVEFYEDPEEYNFTGVVKDNNADIAFYKNGKLHRESEPAIIAIHGSYVEWWYDGKYYGNQNDFTINSWIEKIKFEIFE